LGASPTDPGAAVVRFEVVHFEETTTPSALDAPIPRRAVH
jgi:hypothetical protein